MHGQAKTIFTGVVSQISPPRFRPAHTQQKKRLFSAELDLSKERKQKRNKKKRAQTPHPLLHRVLAVNQEQTRKK
jgi:hypothetical protein